MNKKRKIIVTSALPYSNGNIHVGHLLEYLQTDIWVRFQRSIGNECHYFCADDTHGTPIMIAAKKENIPPEKLIDRNKKNHFDDFSLFGIDFTHYSSTNSNENAQLSNQFFKAMHENGSITKKTIKQSFCENDGMFLPDRFIKGTCPFCKTPDQYGDSCEACGSTYDAKDLLDSRCSECGSTPTLKESEHLFFELNQFKGYLQEWVTQHTNGEVQQKLLEWFDEDLRAWDISRDAPYFGFEIPGHPGKYFYVWVDAPIGYISTTAEWAKTQSKSVDSFWKNDAYEIYHFIGKDIIYFHSLFWPAMLKCAGFTSPKHIFSHGFLTINGKKLSKSRGNAIPARLFAEKIEPQFLRYYFAGKVAGDIRDIDLNYKDFAVRINNELVSKTVNLASRSIKLLHKIASGRLGSLSQTGKKMFAENVKQAEVISQHYEAVHYSKAIAKLREIAETANRYLDGQAPWKSFKTDPSAAIAVLTDVINLFRQIAIMLSPVLPKMADTVATMMGERNYVWSTIETPLENAVLGKYQPLAERVDLETLSSLEAPNKDGKGKPQ